MPVINIKGPIISDDEQWLYDMFEMDATSPGLVQKVIDKAKGAELEVKINSPGGYVDMGSEIYTNLKDYSGKVIVKIVGMAASAASVIAMAGDIVQISPTGRIMIHNASGISRGDYRDMDHSSEVLKQCNSSISNAYMLKTGMDKDKLLGLMDNETYMDAQKAKELGFADEVMFDNDKLLNNLGSSMIPKEIIDKLRNNKNLLDNKVDPENPVCPEGPDSIKDEEVNKLKEKLEFQRNGVASFLFCENLRGSIND